MSAMTGVPDAAELTRRSADLSRSFSLSAAVFLINLVAPLALTSSAIRPVMAVLVVALLAAYVWYAIAAGRAARMLFIIAIMASPLSIKFLLGNQLDQALRDNTTMYLRQND